MHKGETIRLQLNRKPGAQPPPPRLKFATALAAVTVFLLGPRGNPEHEYWEKHLNLPRRIALVIICFAAGGFTGILIRDVICHRLPLCALCR
ncbi:MAG: hypothetical protein WA294_05560 [Acidobacteriaceae bacterium]